MEVEGGYSFSQYSQPGVFQLFWTLIHGLGPWALKSDSFEEHQAGEALCLSNRSLIGQVFLPYHKSIYWKSFFSD